MFIFNDVSVVLVYCISVVTWKNEIELRDMKMQHQLEMNEMQIRVSMLDTQKELVDKISKCKNAHTLYNNHSQLLSVFVIPICILEYHNSYLALY
jgi:hypothetical protein